MKKLLFATTVLVLLAAGSAFVWLNPWELGPQREVSGGLPTPDGRDEGSAPHPLTRDAIASRQYPGSAISVERDLGEQGGFHSYVVSYRSDGLKINSLMNVPSGRAQPAAGWPVLIFNHGYFPPKEYATVSGDYRTWTDGLARAGYLVFKPDYRGHAQSEGNAVGGNWAPDYAYDVLNLIGSIKQYPPANEARIGMFGHSMGGSVTIRAATASADVKASAVLGGVVGNSEELLYKWRRATPRPTPAAGSGFSSMRQRMIDEFGEPKDNLEFWNSISLHNGLEHLAGPVQIHHGTADGVVPIEFSDSLNGALLRAGKPVEYFQYPGTDHIFTGAGGIALQRMTAFFNAALR